MERYERLKKVAADRGLKNQKAAKRLEKGEKSSVVRKRVKPITLYPTKSRSDKQQQQQTIKEELVKLTKVVRQKYKDLQKNAENVERYLKASTNPLVTPLKKSVIEGIKQSMQPHPPLPTIDTKGIKKETTKQETPLHVATQTVEASTATHAVQTQTEDELVERYLKKLSTPAEREHLDLIYGIRLDGKGGTLLGDSTVTFTRSKIIVKDKKYDVSPGLMELLFMQVPKKLLITANDLTAYKDMLTLTNAHRKNYSEEKPINANRGKKYRSVISELFAAQGAPEVLSRALPAASLPTTPVSHTGRGLRKSPNLAYETNVNTLVNRLRLLVMSKAAGHTGHANEILNVENLLRKNKIIL